jgi:very-short-patch-repair endonuclease
VLGVKFRRQYPIGPYVTDFCAPECRLIVELDGSQHAEQAAPDARRTAALEAYGFSVLRFWDSAVLAETQAVLEKLASQIGHR